MTSSFAPEDGADRKADIWCMGKYDVGVRPKIKEGCVKFDPISNWVGINWGTYPLDFPSLNVYRDDRCVVKIGEIPG